MDFENPLCRHAREPVSQEELHEVVAIHGGDLRRTDLQVPEMHDRLGVVVSIRLRGERLRTRIVLHAFLLVRETEKPRAQGSPRAQICGVEEKEQILCGYRGDRRASPSIALYPTTRRGWSNTLLPI
jgi:hypothetical protein